ncbi:GTP 3',8-cyclase MoaA [Thermoproteus uzoniensis]|uniref:GTP 3',8-cyclase MoaA n=1 Tax=Thermoproteus uzoniensis TaxID=184117 RepID=UPI00069C2F79|nr:GTP 3',8-cyclase MoaA [Thermoproteus uzoniensis]
MLVDRYGRPFLKLRVAVNDVCNFSCIFCHFEGQLRGVGRLLNADDYGFLVDVLSKVGVRDYKLTGGEPLLRSDIVDIVRKMNRDGVEISMTTNGFRLAELAEDLAAAGLRRVNVSVHTTDPEKFSKVAGVPKEWFRRVLDGVHAAVKAGMKVKLNAVLLKGINDDRESLRSLVKLAASIGASIQLIELMPVGLGSRVFGDLRASADEVAELLEGMGARPAYTRKDLHNRPILRLAGVDVEIVKNWNNPYFCAGCTTMRLTSDGKLKPCLYREPVVDLYGPIKERDAKRVYEAVSRAVYVREPTFKLKIDYSSSL